MLAMPMLTSTRLLRRLRGVAHDGAGDVAELPADGGDHEVLHGKGHVTVRTVDGPGGGGGGGGGGMVDMGPFRRSRTGAIAMASGAAGSLDGLRGSCRGYVIPETPVRVEYTLTGKGRALGPALAAIGGGRSGGSRASRTARQPRRARRGAGAARSRSSGRGSSRAATCATVSSHTRATAPSGTRPASAASRPRVTCAPGRGADVVAAEHQPLSLLASPDPPAASGRRTSCRRELTPSSRARSTTPRSFGRSSP